MDERKYDEWIAILDNIYARAEELKRKPKSSFSFPEKTESQFDFERLAFERLKNRMENKKITIREYYRFCGALYSLKKAESRQLLRSLLGRFPIETDYQKVWIKE